MEVTSQNIAVINQKLKKVPVVFLDLRYELIDHFVEELKQMDGNFETDFETYFDSRKAMLNELVIQSNRNNGVIGFGVFFRQIFSWFFLLLYVVLALALYMATQHFGKVWVMENFEVLPFVVPGPLSVVLLYQFFYKKQFVRRLVSVMFSFNTVFMFYLMVGITIVRKTESFFGLLLFSFFMTTALYYWIVFFQLRKENEKYLELI